MKIIREGVLSKSQEWSFMVAVLLDICLITHRNYVCFGNFESPVLPCSPIFNWWYHLWSMNALSVRGQMVILQLLLASNWLKSYHDSSIYIYFYHDRFVRDLKYMSVSGFFFLNLKWQVKLSRFIYRHTPKITVNVI